MSYIKMDPEDLKKDYKVVRIMGLDKSVGFGARYYFWVCGDGKQTLFFNSGGEVCVFRNSLFTVDGVYGAHATMRVDGRLKYKESEDSPWVDLGPIVPSGLLSSDTPVDDYKKMFAVAEADTLSAEDIAEDWDNYDDGEW